MVKKRLFIVLIVLTSLGFAGYINYSPDVRGKEGNSDKEKGLVILENTEWTNIWVEKTNDKSLPRLLLIGDSHVQQYYGFVKKELEGRLNLGRYATSKCLGNPFLLKEIKLFLQQYPADVITFNNGLHGVDYPDDVYAKALPKLLNIFRDVAPDAKVIFVNTTPVRDKNDLNKFTPFTDHVKVRNRYAEEIMEKNHIPVVDSWSLGFEHEDYYSPDGIHFNAKGKEAEAKGVAAAVLKVIGK